MLLALNEKHCDLKHRFEQYLDSDEVLEELIETHTKKDQIADPSLKIIPSSQRGYTFFGYTGKSGLQIENERGRMALLSYNLYEEFNGLEDIPVVVQIQAFPGIHLALKALRWERLLLNLFVQGIEEFGFDHVASLPAEQNKNFNERYMEGPEIYSDTIEEHQARMRMRYNVTAKRCGFKFDESSQLYLKEFDIVQHENKVFEMVMN